MLVLQHPGFFRIERGSRSVDCGIAVTEYAVGCAIRNPARVDWWYGGSLELVLAAVADAIRQKEYDAEDEHARAMQPQSEEEQIEADEQYEIAGRPIGGYPDEEDDPTTRDGLEY